MTKTCENCQWAKCHACDGKDRCPGSHGPLYECRFNPPQLIILERDGYGRARSEFPFVESDDYCSHFQPRVEEDGK